MFSYISSERSSGIRRSSGSPERCSRPPRTTRGREASIYHRHRDRIAVSVRRYVLNCGNAPVNQSKLRTQICLIEDQSRERKREVWGKQVEGRVDLGGRRDRKKKQKK